MFDVDYQCEQAVKPVAEALFSELKAFGIFGLNKAVDEETLAAYVEDRIGFIVSFLSNMEQVANLRFSQDSAGRIPYCYHTFEWPDEVPLAGYTGGQPGPSPSQVAYAMYLTWNLRVNEGSAGSRLLRAASMICTHDGFEAAVHYVFDLLSHGFVLDEMDAVFAVRELANARIQADSDEEVAGLLFSGSPPQTPAEWLEAEWQQSDEQTGAAVVQDEAQANLVVTQGARSIIHDCLEAVETVRAANNYDEWLLGQSMLSGFLRAAIMVIGKSDGANELPLGLRSVLSQLEEIMADAGGYFLSLVAGYAGHPLRSSSWFTSTLGAVVILQANVGEGWEERAFVERLLVPAALREYWPIAQETRLPAGWEALSWRFVIPFCQLFAPDRRPQVTSLDIEDQAPTAEAFFEKLNEAQDFIDGGDRETGLARLRDLNKQYPWNSFVYYELAIFYDQGGQPERALEYIFPALVIYPQHQFVWRSLAIILHNLGHGEESVLAQAMNEVVEARYWPDG